MTVTYRYLALVNSANHLLTVGGDKVILSWFFPSTPVFHTVQVLVPNSNSPISIRITDLNK